MTLDQAKAALEAQQQAFTETAMQPNTLERNLVLAGFRAEIGRLQKVIAGPSKRTQSQVLKPAKAATSSAPAA